MSKTVGIVVFPGTNCEYDVAESIETLGGNYKFIFHLETNLNSVDSLVIAGGFAHGDYLRPGAIARFSPVMESLIKFANEGGPVVGICNGFQVLTEAGLLPGALQKNANLTFLCQPVVLKVETTNSSFTNKLTVNSKVKLFINHFSGNYTCEQEVLTDLKEKDQILLTYVDNPNGSTENIAAICNTKRNVVGLMPHPERAISELLGSTDGLYFFKSLI